MDGSQKFARLLRLGFMTATFIAGQAIADNPPDTYGKDYISVLPGIIFTSKALQTQGTGATISGIYGHEFSPHWLSEVNIQASSFDTRPYEGIDYQTAVTVDAVYQLRDRSAGLFTPFVLLGAGPGYDAWYPNNRDGVSAFVEGGVGVVTPPLFKNGLRLRFDARYVRDSREGWHQEPRAVLGIDIPLGRIEHRVEVEYLPAKVEVREVPVERVITRQLPPPPPPADSDGDGVDDAHDKCPDTPHGIRVDAEGCAIEAQTLVLTDVHFEFNSNRITRDASPVLDRLSLAFISQPTLHAEIAGHTDSVGSQASNLALSQKRAAAVREYLIGRGARPDQLTARGFGKSQLLVTPELNQDDAERNRRVEMRVLAR